MNKQYKSGAVSFLLIAAGCVLYMVSGGIRSNFGIIVQSLADRTGVSYADVSFAAAVGQLMYGLAQPFFGIIALKKSNSFVLILGTLLMASGLLLTTLASSVIMLVITVGLMFFTGTGAVCFGIIMGAISPVLGERRASAASGILNASSGIGGSLLSPLMQALQASLGVGKLLIFLSVPVLILLPICYWIARLSMSASIVKEKQENMDIWTMLRQALADPDYRKLLIGFGTCGFHMCIIQTHIYSQIVSYGIADSTASLAYTVFGLTSMAGSVLCGFLCQHLSLNKVLGSLYGIRAVIVLVFMLLLPKNILSVFLFITVLGMTGDATVTPTSEAVSRRFGPESLGFLFGVTFIGHQLGGFLSSWLGGIFISQSGNYGIIWMIDVGLCAIAAAASYAIHKDIKKIS
ncbi:MAG: MFS transporter [Synergistaceae bacterium]|nr:MFS transporter [Synergistaceae bacterium]